MDRETTLNLLWPGRGGPNIDYISAPPSKEFYSKKIRNLIVLGCTGSIGRSTLDVVRHSNGNLKIVGLAAGKNAQFLAQQANEFRAPFLAVQDEFTAKELAAFLDRNYRPRILIGSDAYSALASIEEADCVISAQAGSAGLQGTLSAALAGKVIALANKESLAMAGGLIKKICAETSAVILPVDSEHYALFQCAAGRDQTVKKFILTASGGPFRSYSRADLKNVCLNDALKHPSWNMGKKITIDSATLMNKGLELIEASYLYGLNLNQLDVLVHPQSIIHSLVEFHDNSILAQIAVPDMRLPIAGCLNWPRCEKEHVDSLDLTKIRELTFARADEDTFVCLKLAKQALKWKPSMEWIELGLNPACIVLNIANEKIVSSFLNNKSKFCDIPEAIMYALSQLIWNDSYIQNKFSEPESLSQTVEICLMAIKTLEYETEKTIQDFLSKI